MEGITPEMLKKANLVIDEMAAEYEELPKETRELVYKHKRAQKIQDYLTFVTKYPNDTTKTYRDKVVGALRVLVAGFNNDYK